MTIRHATQGDLPRVGALLAHAFHDDPVSIWLFPSAERRRAAQPPFFEAFARLALDSGGVIYVREDGLAATVWLPGGGDEEDEGDSPFGMLTDEEAGNFAHLAGLMAENHPDRGPHMHLQFIGVHPGHQRTGVGGELLKHNLAVLDQDGTAAYLEASSRLSPPLYQRHGFDHIGTPFGPSPDARMYPMWRPAAT